MTLVERIGPSLSDWAVHRQTDFSRKFLVIFRLNSLSRIWSNLAGFGSVRSNLVEFGRVWSSLVWSSLLGFCSSLVAFFVLGLVEFG